MSGLFIRSANRARTRVRDREASGDHEKLMAMTNVAVFSFGRIGSARCPNKMLRPFGDTTLTDLLLARLARSRYPAFFGGYEPVFAEKCAQHGVQFVQRDERSVTIDEPITDILAFLKELD